MGSLRLTNGLGVGVWGGWGRSGSEMVLIIGRRTERACGVKHFSHKGQSRDLYFMSSRLKRTVRVKEIKRKLLRQTAGSIKL